MVSTVTRSPHSSACNTYLQSSACFGGRSGLEMVACSSVQLGNVCMSVWIPALFIFSNMLRICVAVHDCYETSFGEGSQKFDCFPCRDPDVARYHCKTFQLLTLNSQARLIAVCLRSTWKLAYIFIVSPKIQQNC